MPKKKKNKAQGFAVADLAPLFLPVAPSSPPSPIWRGFLPCLLLALLLRIYASSGDWLVRVDELFQYLEQAHRMVFGYGQVTWEFRMGARTPMLPAIVALPLYICKLIGFTHPDNFIPIVKIWNSVLSLSIPVGMYLFCRRTLGENIARIALLFGCFWHQFILYGSHANAEQYSTEVLFLALALLTSAAGNIRLGVIGFLLGIVVALRLPYLPLVGVLGLILLTVYSPRRWLFVLAGGLGAFVFWGLVDYLYWGRWWHSPRLYLDVIVFKDIYGKAGIAPSPTAWYGSFSFLLSGSYGLYALSAWSFVWWRRYWVLLLLAGSTIVFHTLLDNKEYSNILVVWPMLWMLIAAVTLTIAENRRRRPSSRNKRKGATASSRWYHYMPQLTLAAAMVVTMGVFLFGAPSISTYSSGYYLDPRKTSGLRSELPIVVARYLSRLPAEDMHAVIWRPSVDLLYLNGGYYHTHHRVPLLFPASIDFHKKLLETEGGERMVASHIIANSNDTVPGFTRVEDIAGLGIFVNDEPQHLRPLPDFVTDVLAQAPMAIEAAAKDQKVEFLPPPPAWLYEQSDKEAVE